VGIARQIGEHRLGAAGAVTWHRLVGISLVGPYSSTAVLPMWFATVPALARKRGQVASGRNLFDRKLGVIRLPSGGATVTTASTRAGISAKIA
jgi:hypothetical protein